MFRALSTSRVGNVALTTGFNRLASSSGRVTAQSGRDTASLSSHAPRTTKTPVKPERVYTAKEQVEAVNFFLKAGACLLFFIGGVGLLNITSGFRSGYFRYLSPPQTPERKRWLMERFGRPEKA